VSVFGGTQNNLKDLTGLTARIFVERSCRFTRLCVYLVAKGSKSSKSLWVNVRVLHHSLCSEELPVGNSKALHPTAFWTHSSHGCRGASLIRNRRTLGPCRRPMSRILGWS